MILTGFISVKMNRSKPTLKILRRNFRKVKFLIFTTVAMNRMGYDRIQLQSRQRCSTDGTFHFDLHPLRKTRPMKYMVAWCNHIFHSISNIYIIVANHAVQRRSCVRLIYRRYIGIATPIPWSLFLPVPWTNIATNHYVIFMESTWFRFIRWRLYQGGFRPHVQRDGSIIIVLWWQKSISQGRDD